MGTKRGDAGPRRVFMSRLQEERMMAEALEVDADQRNATSRREPDTFRSGAYWRDEAIGILGQP